MVKPPAHWALAAFCLAVLILLAAQVVLHGPVLQFDRDASLWFGRHRQPWLTQAMLLVSEAHEMVKVLVVAALLALWRGWRRDFAAVRALAAIPAAIVINTGIKLLLHRARPVLDDPLVHLSTYSFPSGHALASTVLYGTLCALAWRRVRSQPLRKMMAAFALAMVLLVCFSRVYLGAHYPSDVLGGSALGILCLLGFQRWATR